MPSQRPDVAVVITTHNYGRYLEECLRSVLAQTLSPRQVIVIDDASSDETASVMGRFPEVEFHSVCFRNGNRARNYGFTLVKTDFVAFFDADDYMAPAFLARLHLALLQNPAADFAYSDRINFGEVQPPRPLELGLWKSAPFDVSLLKQGNYIHLPALIRRRAFTGFDPELQRFQDWDLWLNITVRHGGSGTYVPEPLFHYRIHGSNLTRSADATRAHWYIKRKYRLRPYFRIPILRDSLPLYRALLGVRDAIMTRVAR